MPLILFLFFLLAPLRAQTLVIQHSTVIDLVSAKPLKDYSVVIQNGGFWLLPARSSLRRERK